MYWKCSFILLLKHFLTCGSAGRFGEARQATGPRQSCLGLACAVADGSCYAVIGCLGSTLSIFVWLCFQYVCKWEICTIIFMVHEKFIFLFHLVSHTVNASWSLSLGGFGAGWLLSLPSPLVMRVRAHTHNNAVFHLVFFSLSQFTYYRNIWFIPNKTCVQNSSKQLMLIILVKNKKAFFYSNGNVGKNLYKFWHEQDRIFSQSTWLWVLSEALQRKATCQLWRHRVPSWRNVGRREIFYNLTCCCRL